MAKTALTQLAEQIEAFRKDAYEAGYAAAMQAVRQFTGSSTAAAPSVASTPRAAANTRRTVAKPQPRRSATTAPKPRSNGAIVSAETGQQRRADRRGAEENARLDPRR